MINTTFVNILRQILPPILFSFCADFARYVKNNTIVKYNDGPKRQDLDIYWDVDFANALEDWGKDNTWNEIQMLMAVCKGKVLDVACGTGKTIALLSKFEDIDVYGFDISDLLIQKAISKGIPSERLMVSDATKTNYMDNEFDYSYSIGSLEHFTDNGISDCISEISRYSRICSFNMVPVSRSGIDEGWMKTSQSFYNNSERWWMNKFEKHFRFVVAIPSKWEDKISYGRWFVCYK